MINMRKSVDYNIVLRSSFVRWSYLLVNLKLIKGLKLSAFLAVHR